MKLRMNRGMLLTLLLLSIGIMGAIFFFPINFNNQYTCLYHRIFAPEHSNQLSNEMTGPDETVGKNQEDEIEEMMHSELVTKYVLPFGLMWWMSLIVAASAFFWLRHQQQLRETPKKID